MKKLLSFVLCCGLILTHSTANAQLSKVPVRVTNAFKAKYPEAKNVEWKNKIGVVQVGFDLNGNRCEASFNKSGHWERTEMTVSEGYLPAAVKDGLHKSKYKSWAIISARIIYSSTGKTHYYLVAAKNDLHKKELVFNTNGQLLSDNVTI